MIFLKLDYHKAFDIVDWGFLFAVMERLGMDAKFISMVRLLLTGTTTLVLVNGAQMQQFAIRHRCNKDALSPPTCFFWSEKH